MTRLSSVALSGALLVVAAASAACNGDGGTGPAPLTGIVFVAGDSGTDTVTARRDQALVVEVRDSTGRAQPQVSVQFTVGAPPDTTRRIERGLALCGVLTTTCDATQGVPAASRAELTNDLGRASVVVHHGTVSGPVWVHVYVPELGLRDSTRFTTLPGRLAELRPSVSDTTILIGASFAAALATLDRFGNSLGGIPGATVAAGSGRVRVQGGVVTGAAIGRTFVVHAVGEVRDTTWVTVLPVELLASRRGVNLLAVSHFNGTETRAFSVSDAAQYGLRPRWVPGGSRILVHSGGVEGIRLRTVDPATGAVTTLPSLPALAGQYFPDPTASWIHFNGQSTSGSFTQWRMRLDGTGIEQVPATSPAYPGYYRGALSPDGTKLIMSVIELTVGVRVFDAVTGVALSPFIADATSPVWSPDGQRVAFTTPRSGPLRVMRADGSELRTVSATAFGEYVDWTNDGEWLVAEYNAGLALVRVADGELLPLGFGAGTTQPAVQR